MVMRSERVFKTTFRDVANKPYSFNYGIKTQNIDQEMDDKKFYEEFEKIWNKM